jgi:hypothetical protein
MLLDDPARCADEDPRPIGAPHAVACHFPLEREENHRDDHR